MVRRTVEEKLAFIDEWKDVEQQISQRQFCMVNNLTPSTFNKWLSNAERLRQTRANKKNVQRSGQNASETRLLEAYVTNCASRNTTITVIDLLAYAREQDILNRAKSYITRYMFCRRILLAHALKNPTPSTAVTRLDMIATASTSAPDEQNALSMNRLEQLTNFRHTNEMIFVDAPPQEHRIQLGRCGCTDPCTLQSPCVNRGMAEDCNQFNFSSAGNCENRWVGKTLEQFLEVFKTQCTGHGVRSKQVIPAGTVVIEYLGEYIKHRTYQTRCTTGKPPTSTYYMKCDKTFGIDARTYGNLARFINHACDPNLAPEKRVVDHTTRVFLVATKCIQPQQELTFSYSKPPPFLCLCSAHPHP